MDAVFLDRETCDRARLARDPRFDGRFFIGVRTTKIYCRSICPVRPARAENVRYFPTAAAAAEAGFRPCLRCRPESAPGSPAWRGSAATVTRGTALIEQGFLDEGSVADLGAALGMGARHLTRLFTRHLGASPGAIAATRRIHLAKKLIDETDLSMTEVAFAAGFASLRRFNAVMRETYGRPPSALRRGGVHERGQEGVTLRLGYRPPFDWPRLARLLAAEAIPGVEQVTDAGYRRAIAFPDGTALLGVRPVAGESAILLTLHRVPAGSLAATVDRVRRILDLSVDPVAVADQIGGGGRAGSVAGARLPGCWDGLELAVRAAIAREVPADAVDRLLARIVRWPGPRAGAPSVGLTAFPVPALLAEIAATGRDLPRSVARAIERLATATVEGRLRFDSRASQDDLARALHQEGGLERPAAHWIAMRTLGEPDADPAAIFPAIARAALRAAAALKPWRSYGVVRLAERFGPPTAGASDGSTKRASQIVGAAGSVQVTR